MNAQQATTLHTPYLLDQEWVAAINEALATPATVPFAIEPVCLASYDVMHGISMRPEKFYRTAVDCHQYILAYLDAVEAWAAKVDEVNATAASGYTDLEYAEMTAEYQDWMQDMDWMRGGM